MTFFLNKDKKKVDEPEIAHTHTSSEVTDLNTFVDLKVKNFVTKHELETHTHTELDFSEEFLASLKGDRGEQGLRGIDGKDGKDGVNGVNGLNGRDGLNGKDGEITWVSKDASVILHTEDGYYPASLILASYKRVGDGVETTIPIDYVIRYRVRGNGEPLLYKIESNKNLVTIPIATLDTRPIESLTIEATNNGRLVETIRIPVVKNGEKGIEGKPLLFEDLTLQQLALLKGEKGDTGATGLTHANTNNPLHVWTGHAILQTDGIWSVNYTSANFTEVYSVVPIAQAVNDTAAETPIAASLTSFTNTTATGKCHKGTSAGLLAAMSNLWANKDRTTVYVTVIGKRG